MRASTSLALPPSLGEPDVLLWGVPVNDQGEPRYDEEAMALRRRLVSVLHDLGETPSHYTEPDVALFWQDGSLVIIEAVFGAPNARTTSPSGRVALDALAFADPTAVVATGYCRLARLWQIAYQLGAGGSLSLLNVGTRHLEASVPSRRRLAIFRRSLARPTEGGFAVVHWTDLLPDKPEMPRWLVDYCRSRNIWPLRDAQPPLPKR